MKLGSMLLVIWIVIGLFAAYQRGYLSERTKPSCTSVGNVAITAIAGPLNYLGANPKMRCTTPEPSK